MLFEKMSDFSNLQPIIHYGMHFLVPFIFAFFYDRQNWLKITLILWATMLVDLDHLLADPIFDPGRCSINFHPLHTYYAMTVYTIMLLPAKTRLIGVALLWHMVTDYQDCLWH